MTNKEALEILKTEWDINAEIFDTSFHEALAVAIKVLEERQQGEWINEYWEDAYQESYHTCSICKMDIRTTYYDNFCPNCGADMRGKNNGN